MYCVYYALYTIHYGTVVVQVRSIAYPSYCSTAKGWASIAVAVSSIRYPVAYSGMGMGYVVSNRGRRASCVEGRGRRGLEAEDEDEDEEGRLRLLDLALRAYLYLPLQLS